MTNPGPKQPAESKAVARRLGFAAGQAGQFAMAPQVTGPILFSDAPKPIQELFDDESKKITRIIVVHRDLNRDKDPADGFVWLWDRMEEVNEPP